MDNKKVSIWIGRISNEEILDSYTEIDYDSQDYCSQFMRDFGIEASDCDEDFFENCFYENPINSNEDLFKGFSYDEQIIKKIAELQIRVKELPSINTVIMIYNYEYKGTNKNIVRDDIDLVFLSSVDYE